MHPLDGATLKFNRACTQFKSLNEAVEEFIETCRTYPCPLVFEPDIQAGQIVARIKFPVSPPIEWALIIGEIAHNLRSCLDHIVWELAMNGTTAPDDKTEFPIFSDGGKYNRARLNKIGCLSAAQQTFIERLQPYQARNDALSHPLWLLYELNNTDKHRLLPISQFAAFCGPDTGTIHVYTPNGRPLKVEIILNTQPGQPMEDGTKFFTLKILEAFTPGKGMKVDTVFTQEVVFGTGVGANSGREVIPTLHIVAKQVQTILLDCKKQFS